MIIQSSNVNPLFEENDKDVEIKSSPSFTLTSPEESECGSLSWKDSIHRNWILPVLPPLSSGSNPTSPTLTGEKVFRWYRYIKNHKKTAKKGQTRTRETEEHKRSQRFKTKARKSQVSVKDSQILVNKSQPPEDKAPKCFKSTLQVSSSLIGSLMPRRLKEAQEMMIFALDHSHNKHKGHIKDCQLGNPCEFNCDPRVIINPPIIKRTYRHDLEERVEQAKG
ncbi:hypothetical protein Tco_0654822 [Tanacetum coccineum]|uniref:Uncharacterized protein n=1 Tax=Tanacetum coccineum TaxID=301880 RepID=A0ABQ4X4T0_9ASTR